MFLQKFNKLAEITSQEVITFILWIALILAIGASIILILNPYQ